MVKQRKGKKTQNDLNLTSTSNLPSDPNSQIQSSPRRRSSRVRKPIISQVESNSDEDEESLPSSDHHPQPHRKKSKTLAGSKKPIRTRKPRIQKPKTKLNINLNSKRNEDQEHDPDEGLRSDRETGNHLKSDYVISQDNDLFNSIQKGSSAIEPTLEDWIEMYKGKDQNQTDSNEDARAEGIAVLINCILRCCGCNNSIDKDEALDLDAVPERLDDIQEEFKKVPNHAYPLINSRINKSLKMKFTTKKNFEKNLINFFETLINLSHNNLILYNTDLMTSIQTYLVSMTTSSLRSIRHTSTFICLFGLMSSFIEILIQVSDELNQLKKKVSDLKNKNHNNRSGTDERLIEWEKRKSLVSDQKESLENHLNDFFDGVFVHRYRDSDPKIRVECIQALGQWMNQLPDHFLGGHYLRYLGWVLTDTNKEARFEAMKALKNLYSKEDNLGPMQHFTTRFKSRFLEIAIGEPELISRCLAIEILTIVDSHGGILENQQRNQLMKLIFDQEIRVRRSISKFFKNFLNEVYDSKRMKIGSSVKNEKRSKGKESKTNGGSIEGDQIEKGLKLKCLASLLIKFGKDGNRSVENRQEREDDLSSNHQTEPEEEEEEEEATDEEGRNEGTMGIGSLSEFPEKSRIALAIESLWDEIEVIRDWQSMSDYLLLDHSTVITEAAKNGRTSKSRKNRRGSMIRTGEGEDEDEDEEDDDEYGSVEEGCKLTEHEENVLLEIFLVTLSQSTESLTEEELLIQKERLKKKKRRLKQKEKQKEGLMTEEEEERSEEEEEEREEELNGIGMVENSNKIEISKVMMKVFPKLYTKYSHDPIRLSEVLRIPKLLSLGLYLDLRMVSAYENLWDILINEYIKQQVQRTISVISSTINHLLSFARSLSHINIKKIEHLDKVLLKNLKRLAFKEEEEEDRMIDLETCGFELQEIDRFYFSLLKITYLFRSRDLSSILLGISDDDLDDDHMMLDGSVKKTVVIEIILGLANRGRLNYPEEIKMVEVAIEILQLNFMWTCASSSKMMNEVLEIEEESEKKKKEEEQKELVERVLKFRDRFLDLMKEYAIDPECNACDNIKRAAFIHLLNIYMISYGSLMPDQLKIDCDQQTQFRCAGFIAAEIERFGNQMKEKAKEKGKWRIDDEEETEEEEEEVDRRGKKGKGKEKEKKVSRADRQRMYRSSSFKELRIQEEFEMLMTTFTKAICCGVIDIQHSNVILAHFNRFGDVFDLGVEVLIGSLKGFCFGNGEISGPKKEALAKTVSESFRESFELFLNEEIGSEEQFIKVSKLLASSIVIRGARLSVKSILDQQSYVILHNGLIDWALKQIIKFEKDFDRLDRFGVFFKGLYSLMIGMDGRAALKIKSSIDLSLEKNEIEIPRNSKAWDPYRTYIKRLISIMAKDPTIKRAAKLTLKRKADQNEAEADEDDHERIRVDDEATEDEVEGEGERSQAPSSRLQDRSEEGLNDLPEKRIKKTSRHSTIGKGKARAVSDEIPSDEEDEEESTRVETQSNQQTEKTLKKASKSIKNKKGRTNEILENQSSTDHGMRTEMNLKRRHQSSQLECVMIPNQSSPSSPSIQPSTPNPLRKRSSLLSVMIPISHPKRKRFDHDENEEGSDERNRVEEVKSVGSESKKRRIENGNRNGNGNGNGNEKSEEGSEERVGVEVEEEDEEDEEIGSEISLAEVKRRARKGKK